MTTDPLAEYFSSSRKPVLFAGAGVSMRVGLPSWPQLLVSLANHIRTDDPLTATHIEQDVAAGHLGHAALLYMSTPRVTPVKKQKGLQTLLTASSIDGLAELVQLPFSALATTNFDRTLLDACAKYRGHAPTDHFWAAPDFLNVVFDEAFYVARIHGRIDGNGRIAFSSVDYDRLETDATYLDVLRHLLTQTQLLFVGFSFLDPAIASVLSTLNRLYGGRAQGQHVALIPSDSDQEFVRSLERFNIKRAIYDPANGHQALWDLVSQFSTSRKSAPAAHSVAPKAIGALDATRRFLSSTYARITVTDGADSLKKAAIEGIVLGVIIEHGTQGVTEAKVKERVRTLVGLKKKEVDEIVGSAVKNLLRARLVRDNPSSARGRQLVAAEGVPENPLSSALSTLEVAVLTRLSVMRGVESTTEIKVCVRNTLEDVVYERGWDLGVSFLDRQAPPNIDIEAHVRKHGPQLSTSLVQDVSAALKNVFALPTPSEAELLTVLGRAGFSIALLYAAPRSTLVQASILPRRIYLDASVLLPAIVQGHRNQQLYSSTVATLHKAATQAGLKIEIVAYQGYLNEIVSHRRRAQQEFEIEGKNFEDFAKRSAVLYGSENLNVFIGAYAQRLMSNPKATFPEFLREVAPYETEKSLARFIARHGIRIAQRNEIEGSKFPKISFALQKAYASDLVRRKSPMLIEHDAIQLSALEKEASRGLTSVWVSADQRLRGKLAATAFHQLNDHIVSHVGFAQLVDLLTGVKADPLAYSGLLWGVRPSDEAELVKDFFIRRGLEHYSEAYAMEMPKLVDQIVEKYEAAARGQMISIDSDKDVSRAVRLVGGFEDEFFAAMDAQIKKRKAEK